MIRFSRAAASLLAAAALSAHSAMATEGYFLEGYGTREKAVGGAGAADSRDPLALSINPAGLVDVQDQYTLGLTAFSPDRGYWTSGPGFVAPGYVQSGRGLFPIPNDGYSQRFNQTSAWGVAVYGNGGMNTTYSADYAGQAFPSPFCGKTGVFCGRNSGVDLNQAFITAGYAQSFGRLSVGFAPVLAVQIFKARGLEIFAPFSSAPEQLTNHSYNWSVGAGVRAGLQYKLTDSFRVGVAGSSPIWMSPFENYKGLFANRGDFDIPANLTAGVAYDVLPTFTLLADWKHIFYSQVPSVGNSSTEQLLLGAMGGPGFGWRDINVIKVGGEYRGFDKLALRLGYSYNTNPINPRDVTLNILAPAVTKHHISGGLSYYVTPSSSIDLAAVVSPRGTVSGIERTPLGPNHMRTITLFLSSFEITAGWTHRFDAAPVSVAAKF
ncbi:OmpP1/FadL family transporter [Methylocystis sp. ATCC 49242]|jgi:long-chain fatty acid transport protein|uniref:OmpP1/FadL family transporter n=1 Tax=Methylocystis sp. ATCC 49242 TaxID=622637 RepID=UPI0001F8741C|nr:outer membrane protein transport protein [Methylocystis sp. ATCC 49242]